MYRLRFLLVSTLITCLAVSPSLASEKPEPNKNETTAVDETNGIVLDMPGSKRHAKNTSIIDRGSMESDLGNYCDHDPEMWMHAPNV